MQNPLATHGPAGIGTCLVPGGVMRDQESSTVVSSLTAKSQPWPRAAHRRVDPCGRGPGSAVRVTLDLICQRPSAAVPPWLAE
jgi:hypothetical protein